MRKYKSGTQRKLWGPGHQLQLETDGPWAFPGLGGDEGAKEAKAARLLDSLTEGAC